MVLMAQLGLAVHLAQLADPGIDTPEEAALIFSGPQFFIALLSGLVLAFGFQLLLTNLSVAAGISYVGTQSSSKSSSSKSSSGLGLGGISIAVGAWTLITVSLALFFACWLAIKLSLYSSTLLGVITGLVIWGTYFSLLFWVSSTTVGSLIGSVVRTATASFNSLVGTATAALGARSASHQVVETAEVVAATIRKELSQTLDDNDVLETFHDYVETLRSPELDTQTLETEFERLIKESGVTTMADRETLDLLGPDTFEALVNKRTDLSRKEVKRISGQLYETWRRTLGQENRRDPLAELVDYVQTSKPGEAITEPLGEKLDEFLAEYRKQGKGQSSDTAISQGLNAVMAVVMGRTDLSDLDVEKVAEQVKQAKSQLVSQGNMLVNQVGSSGDESDRYSVVKADIEHYLMNTYPWQMKAERLQTNFRELLYDTQADVELLKQELSSINRSYFEDLLRSRGLMTMAEIERTSLILESVRRQVLEEVIDIYCFEQAQQLEQKVHIFLKETPRDELMSNMGQQAFMALLSANDTGLEALHDRVSKTGPDFFAQTLRVRPDLTEPDVQYLAAELENWMNKALADNRAALDNAKVQMENQWQSLQDYLRSTGKPELNPEAIKRDIKVLMTEPDAGIHRLRQRMAQFDRDTLVQLLNQRQDLSESDIRQVLREVENNWMQVVNAPADLTTQAKATYKDATQALEQYLRQTGKPELNPEGIKRDLQTLLNDPKTGMGAMKARLSSVDRDTLVQLLSQRQDLSEQDVNQIIDDVLSAIHDVIKMPRRMARRVQQEVLSFEQQLEDYLRNTDKAELDPDGIKRDMQVLLNDPRLGTQRLADRLSYVNQDTVTALLAQRQDMSPEEAEATVEKVMAARDQILSQVRMVQRQVQNVLKSLLVRVRNYLNSLNRPELSYAVIRQDLRKIFNDPNAGLDVIKSRFSKFDRDTLLAVLSSSDALSEADAQRVVGQIESVRDSALQKAERLEQEVESRVHALKAQAYQQVEDTRKAAEVAAWWLFGTATMSAIASAIGGALAVMG